MYLQVSQLSPEEYKSADAQTNHRNAILIDKQASHTASIVNKTTINLRSYPSHHYLTIPINILHLPLQNLQPTPAGYSMLQPNTTVTTTSQYIIYFHKPVNNNNLQNQYSSFITIYNFCPALI